MEIIRISELISYLPSDRDPLSADVGIIHGKRYEWVFDVGSNEESLQLINNISREKKIIISHFHEDHMGNISRIEGGEIYCGDYTFAKLKRGIQVTEPLNFSDGAELTVFPVPSTHSKGAVGLKINGSCAFVGDAVYGAPKNAKEVYNVNRLKEMMAFLEKLDVQTLLLSHEPGLARPKSEVLSELQKLYSGRKPGEAYIFKEDEK